MSGGLEGDWGERNYGGKYAAAHRALIERKQTCINNIRLCNTISLPPTFRPFSGPT